MARRRSADRTSIFLVALLLVLFWGAAPPLAWSEERTAETILSEYDGVRYPGFRSDLSEEEYGKLVKTASRQQCKLAKELYDKHPGHERIAKVMESRWILSLNVFGAVKTVLTETDAVIARKGGDELTKRALICRAWAALLGSSVPIEKRFTYVKEAIAANPKDGVWGPALLHRLAVGHVANPKRQREILELLVKRYKGGETVMAARSHLKLLQKVGKPVELEFKDARDGKPAGLGRLRGQKVVIWRWWASKRKARGWVPQLKRLDVPVLCVHEGMEPAKVVAVAKDLDMPWPQLAEADFLGGWARKFGIHGLKFLLIDEEGRLSAVTSRVEPLRRVLSRGNPAR